MMYERYCELRDSMNLKDSDIARQTGITPSTFSDWKKGNSAPNTLKMIAIARVLHTSVEYLVTGEKENTFCLTEEEALLIHGFHAASPEQQDTMIYIARKALGNRFGKSEMSSTINGSTMTA